MSKIHELIAAEGDKNEIAGALVREAEATFSKRTDHFHGHVKKIEMYDEEREQENMEDHKEVVTTVDDKLLHVWDALSAAIDVTATKENSNTSRSARADVVVNGEVVLMDVPATALLGLERRLGVIKSLYMTIPTLDPSFAWVEDAVAGPGYFRTQHEQMQQRTEKVMKHKVLYEATDKHPAQIEKYTIDEGVGKITTTRLSGMVSPATKALWLDRISKLHTAVKEARQRANMAEVEPLNLGGAIRGFIHQP